MINCEFEDGGKAKLRHVTTDVIVVKDGKILMVRRNQKLLEGGKWGLAGGFMDRDETVAQCATREVYEETGWEIQGLTLLTIVDGPDRPHEDRQNVSFVYFCEAVQKTGEPDWESDAVEWFGLDDLPPDEQIAFDHAKSIGLYKKYLTDNLPLPILSA
ncbi:MAG TPA: NUDIX hydrolase [Candidatus Saccharimonadales bacterium]|nr:NUDIX hydrolase [Candidatus Saccharimonadales bacterium]